MGYEEGSLTIRISNTTKKRVQKIGVFGQSWDELLNEMVDFIEDHEDEWYEAEGDEE